MAITAYLDTLAHIRGALQILNLRLHRHVVRWRADHHAGATSDELAGLYTSDAAIDHLINQLYPRQITPGTQTALQILDRLIAQQTNTHMARQALSIEHGVGMPLVRLANQLELDSFEQNVVLLALANEFDQLYGRLFGYLNNDLIQRLPTAALASALFSQTEDDAMRHRLAFASDARLRALRVIQFADNRAETPLAGRGFRLDEPLAVWLLGGFLSDPALRHVVQPGKTSQEPPILDTPTSEMLRSTAQFVSTQSGAPLIVNLHGGDAMMLRRAAEFMTGGWGPDLLHVDAAHVTSAGDPEEMMARLRRISLLSGSAIVIGDMECRLLPHQIVALASGGQRCLLLTRSVWQSGDLTCPTLRVHMRPPDSDTRRRLWDAELRASPLQPDVDLLVLADRFALDSGRIAAAAAAARVRAQAVSPRRLCQVDLFAICREQVGRELESLAQRIETRHTWDDLILPAQVKAQLLSIMHWVRYRHIVLNEWHFGERTAPHGGISALFSGPSGTGKTLSTGILGASLGLEVYRIDLSAVVSKYIGETEKNLERIFNLAEAANAVLFFDEADALFGKRSEVQDAHDRYANIEVSYLLQRMERYPGIAILATNLKQNLDAAFLRRLNVTVEFPFPKIEERLRLWRCLIPKAAPLANDVDFDFLAGQFAFAGGNIKNCVLDAAFAAAGMRESCICMRHLVRAVARELAKLERPVLRSEFGAYFEIATVELNGDDVRMGAPAS